MRHFLVPQVNYFKPNKLKRRDKMINVICVTLKGLLSRESALIQDLGSLTHRSKPPHTPIVTDSHAQMKVDS